MLEHPLHTKHCFPNIIKHFSKHIRIANKKYIPNWTYKHQIYTYMIYFKYMDHIQDYWLCKIQNWKVVILEIAKPTNKKSQRKYWKQTHIPLTKHKLEDEVVKKV